MQVWEDNDSHPSTASCQCNQANLARWSKKQLPRVLNTEVMQHRKQNNRFSLTVFLININSEKYQGINILLVDTLQ